MKNSDILLLIDHVKLLNKNRFYISEEFISWYMGFYNKSSNEAIETYDLFQKKILKKIKEYISHCDAKYIHSEFKFCDFDDDVLISSKFDFSKGEQEEIQLKLKWRNNFYSLLKEIDWREFELLGKLILTENHIDNIRITKSQKDQGIDFFGYFELKSEEILPRFYNYLRFRIVGQVKHSENNKGVDHQKVASFGTEINKLRKAKDKSYFENLDDDFLNSSWPILGIFITNSYYPTKAQDFANEYGIIFWDGVQISQDLSNKKNIERIFDETTKQITVERLRDYIKEFSK